LGKCAVIRKEAQAGVGKTIEVLFGQGCVFFIGRALLASWKSHWPHI